MIIFFFFFAINAQVLQLRLSVINEQVVTPVKQRISLQPILPWVTDSFTTRTRSLSRADANAVSVVAATPLSASTA